MNDNQYNTIESAAYLQWQNSAAPHETTYRLAVQNADAKFLRCQLPDYAAYNDAVQTARQIWKDNTYMYWDKYVQIEESAWTQLIAETPT